MKNNFISKYFAEAFATFCLIFIGTGAIVVNHLYGGLGPLGICLSFGFIVTVMIYGIGHISGAHMNPAVTIGFWAAGRADCKEVIFYSLAQLSGALLASWSLKAIFYWDPQVATLNLGMTLPIGHLARSFILEVILTFILMFVIMSVATDDRAQGKMAGLAIGFLITVLALVGGPISGASMNPVRSLAPAIVSGNLHAQWIYIAAPIIGAFAAGWSYQHFRGKPCEQENKTKSTGCC